MSNKEILKEYFILEEKAKILAHKYANKMMDYGGSLYSSVSFMQDYFHFQYGPVTYGLSWLGKLPNSLIDSENQDAELEIIVNKEKKKLEELRLKNTCKECGHYKNELNNWKYNEL